MAQGNSTITKELVSQIETKFTILLTIGVVFPVLMATFFTVSGGTPKDQQNAFLFCPLVSLYILAFVFFELAKRLPPVKAALQALDWILLIGIACFALPIMFTITVQGPIAIPNHLSYQVDVWTYAASMWGIVIIPWVIFFFSVVIIGIEWFASAFPVLAKKKMF